MKRMISFLLACVMLCLCVTACDDDTTENERHHTIKPSTSATNHSQAKMVDVPKFIGLMYHTEIEDKVEYAEDFVFEVIWEDANNPDWERGAVFKQMPAVGEMVEQGSTVTLYVNNGGPQEIYVNIRDSVEGYHKNEVRDLLQKIGFTVKEVFVNSETVPADHVVSINIEKGVKYPYGTEVIMTVSDGSVTGTGTSTTDLEVPNFIGMIYDNEIDGVKKYEDDFDIQVVWSFSFSAAPRQPGEVIKQEPKQGTVVPKGSTVRLYVINEITLDVTAEIEGRPKDEIRVLLQDAGFVVAEEYASSETIPAGSVIGVSVEQGVKYAYGTKATMIVSTGCKGVVVELDWPSYASNMKSLLDVRVLIDGKVDQRLSNQYVGYRPSSTEKMVFELTNHPAGEQYTFEVRMKNHSERDGEHVYVTYVVVKINPKDGTWEIDGGYLPMPGLGIATILVSEAEALALAIEYFGTPVGTVDPNNGFPISYVIMDDATEEDPYYRVGMRWLVDGSHYSVLDWVYVDAFSGEVLANHP